MRKFTLITILLLAATMAFSQLVLVNSPASISGSYDFSERADEWGANLLDSVWTGDAVLMDDAVDPNSDGCTPTTNDYTDNIVLVDRGACSFSLKAYHAELAGATGCIIINNAPGGGLVGMLGGDSAALVTIPVAFITFEDGLILKEAVAAGTVNISMGNIKFDNDVNINSGTVLIPYNGTIPASQVGADSSYVYTPALDVINNGRDEATSIEATATINFTPNGGSSSEVYSNSAMVASLMPDSSEVVLFPDYLITDATLGTYEVVFEVTPALEDELPNDNRVAEQFSVRANVASKASWDEATNQPTFSFPTTIADGLAIEFYSGITFPEGGVQIDSFVTTIGINDDGLTLDGQDITFTLSEWNDMNGDFNLEDGELTSIGVNTILFDATATDEETVVLPFFSTAPDGGPVAPLADVGYFVGMKYLGSNVVTFGFDATYDNLITFEEGLANSDLDFPYLYTTSFPDGTTGELGAALSRFTDFGNTLQVGYYLSDYVSSVNEIALNGDINVYPNPASNELWLDVNLAEVAETLQLSVYDATGKLISSRKVQNVKEDKIQFNTTRLNAGTFYIKVRSDNEVKTLPFVIVK